MLRENFKRQFLLYFVAFGLIIASIASAIGYAIQAQYNKAQIKESAELIAKNRKDDFLKSHIDRMDSQVESIGQVETIKEFVQQPSASIKTKLIDMYLLVAISDKQIMQVRFLDASGKERVRIDRQTLESKPYVVDDSKLQDKSDRDYFQIVSKLSDGQIWHSSLDLNIEHGKVEVPYRPTFRVAKPIFIDNKFSGMVIINVLIDNLIGLVGQSAVFDHYVVDKNGYFIIHPDEKLSWSRYSSKAKIQEVFGEDGAKVIRGEQMSGDMYVFALEDVLRNGENIRLVLKPKAEHQKSVFINNIKTTMLTFFACVLLGTPLAYFLARGPSRLQAKLLENNRKLEENEMHLRTIIENEPECIKIVDKSRKILQMNPAGLRMIEADSVEQVAGQDVLGVIDEKYHEEYKNLHAKVLAGEVAQMQYEVRGLKGSKRWLETHAVPMYENGKVVHLAVTRDITESKMQNQFRELLLASLGDGVYGVDTNGICTFINEAALTMLGYEEGEVIGFNQHDLLHHCYKDGGPYPEDECPIYLTANDGQIRESNDVFICKDNKYIDVHLKVAPIVQDGNVAGAVVVFQDITERLGMEENLRLINKHLKELVHHETEQRVKQEKLLIQQSKMAVMGEMIGAIAHQWRQPLNSLNLGVQDIEMAYEFGELDGEYVAKYKKESMHIIQMMSNTIDDFRNFFSANKKQEEFYLEDAINDVLNILSSQLKINSINVLFGKESGGRHKYTCNKNELKQVVLNILANAKDALLEKRPAVPFIKIEVTSADGKLEVAIEDSAGGIPDDIIGKVFDSHFTTKEEGKGTGIGLYMSKQIVEESLHGKLTVSNSENGARFIVELPRV